MKEAAINIKCDKSLKYDVEIASKADDRDISSWVRIAIKEKLSGKRGK